MTLGPALQAIAVARSPYRQKLGVPRQAGLAPDVRCELQLDASFVGPESVRGLEGVSHVWLVWGFSEHFGATRKDTVRPPRLGGAERLGVFATRSSFRPNPLGLSVVKLLEVDFPRLVVAGADLLDGTPIYDIKPYLPWAESIPEARCDWAPQSPTRLHVRWSPDLAASVEALDAADRRAIEQSLALDPRPAWERDKARTWSTRIASFDVSFEVSGETLMICGLRHASG